MGDTGADVPAYTGRGRRQTLSLKYIIDAVFYINANGCTWADRPHDFPPPSSVSYHDTKWMRDGTWRRINDALREAVQGRRTKIKGFFEAFAGATLSFL